MPQKTQTALFLVAPAKAGVQSVQWVPAFVGKTNGETMIKDISYPVQKLGTTLILGWTRENANSNNLNRTLLIIGNYPVIERTTWNG